MVYFKFGERQEGVGNNSLKGIRKGEMATLSKVYLLRQVDRGLIVRRAASGSLESCVAKRWR